MGSLFGKKQRKNAAANPDSRGASAPADTTAERTERCAAGKVFLASAAVTAAVWIGLALAWDFYFDLNDDVLMKDILSGRFTGTPESRNIQMLYPLSWLISRGYKLFRGQRPDVYGAFLLLLQAVSFGLVLFRTIRMEQKAGIAVWMRVVSAVSVCLPMGVMCLYHAVFVQYSVTCAFLCGAAAYLFMTMELPGDPEASGYLRKFIAACLPSVILVLISFPLRSEMTLLCLPLVLSGALFAYIRATKRERVRDCFAGKGAAAVLLVLILLGAGMGAEEAADRAALRSPDWQEFRAFFDARTELYDFCGAPPVPDYDEYEEAYRKARVTREETELLNNYNFDLDDSMDAAKLERVVQIAKSVRAAQTTRQLTLRNAGWNYRNSMVSPTYMPYNVLAAAGYLLLLLTAVSELLHRSLRQKDPIVVCRARRDFIYVLFCAFFLFLVRTALWMAIMIGGRFPDRITHSLFLVEFMVLAGLILVRGMRTSALTKEPASWSVDVFAAQLMLIAVSVMLLPGQVHRVQAESARRAQVNQPYLAYLQYCADHPENFYFTDVYSTVDFSEKMFAAYPDDRGRVETGQDGSAEAAGTNGRSNPGGNGRYSSIEADSTMPAAHDLCGGWAAKSPLSRKKLAAFGYSSASQALIQADNAYFVAEKGTDMAWLVRWYASQDITAAVRRADTIGDSFDVWKVTISH